MPDLSLTILNRYELHAPAREFEAAIVALASRVQREGHLGVRSYRFFVDANENLGRAVIEYSDADAWIGHHDISMNWPEMQALHKVATLSEVVFLGDVTMEIRDWLAGSSLKASILSDNRYVAGFRRKVD